MLPTFAPVSAHSDLRGLPVCGGYVTSAVTSARREGEDLLIGIAAEPPMQFRLRGVWDQPPLFGPELPEAGIVGTQMRLSVDELERIRRSRNFIVAFRDGAGHERVYLCQHIQRMSATTTA